MVVYEIEIDEAYLVELDRHRFIPGPDIWKIIADYTGRHVNSRWCRMVVLARGADTLTHQQLMSYRATRYTFEKAP